MATGINQNIEILGRMLHIQTELSRGDDPRIRTTVYDGGRIVATREVVAKPADDGEGEILEQIRVHHALIVDNLVTRSAALAERKLATPPVTIAGGAAAEAARAVQRGYPLPAGTDPSLRRSLRTRRLVGPFRHRFATDSRQLSPCDAEFEAAGTLIEAIMGSPAFSGLRLDEQVRFFDLKERIELRRTGDDPDSKLSALLDDITAFARHLAAINDRLELSSFDHRLLLWAIGAIGACGVTDDILGHLESLRGRDAGLDRQLDDRPAIDEGSLLEVLIGLLDRTIPLG